jgi:hypothetical protein
MENETYYAKISGKVNIPKKIEIAHNYRLTMDCSVTQEQRNDNNNGTFDVVSKVEPITCEIQKDNGEIIKGKDTRKESQKLRSKLYMVWQSNNNPLPFEEYYQKALMNIRLNAEEILATYTTL